MEWKVVQMIKLWIKDKYIGNVHEVGTNAHDSLIVWNGTLVYENLQNGDGTLDGYLFCNEKGETDLFPDKESDLENFILIGDTVYGTNIDAVPVVRCKDCKYFQRYTQTKQKFGVCKYHNSEFKETDFCSYGERRDDNDGQRSRGT